MKDTIYFQHDYNSHVDPKMIKLRVKWWWKYYWLFRATLEIMREEADILLRECDIDANALRLYCERNTYVEFLWVCVDVGLLIYDDKDKVYYSERLQDDAEHMREKSRKAKASADARRKKRPKKNANALQTQSERNAIYDSIVYDKINNINIELDKKITNFIEFRTQIKKPLTEQWLKSLLTKLLKLWKNDEERIEILEQSILNNWQWIFELKNPVQQKPKTRTAQDIKAERDLFLKQTTWTQ